jgi:uncharacterized protein
MMHTIRLLQSANQIIATGTLNIQVPNREELLAIKAGNWAYDALMQKADDLMVSIENHYKTSPLPECPNAEKAIANLIEIREGLYR